MDKLHSQDFYSKVIKEAKDDEFVTISFINMTTFKPKDVSAENRGILFKKDGTLYPYECISDFYIDIPGYREDDPYDKIFKKNRE